MDAMDDKSTATTTDATSAAHLRLELADLSYRRQTLLAQLGEAVFGRMRSNPAARKNDEFLYAAIESIDQARIELQETLDHLQGATAGTIQATSLVCPSCGSEVMRGDLFCMACGVRLVSVTEADEPTTEDVVEDAPAAEAEPIDEGAPEDQGSSEALVPLEDLLQS